MADIIPRKITTEGREEIRKRAEAATPGKRIAVQPRSQEGGRSIAHTGAVWDRSKSGKAFPVRSSVREAICPAGENPHAAIPWEQAEADADLIAALDRETVLSLLAHIAALEAETRAILIAIRDKAVDESDPLTAPKGNRLQAIYAMADNALAALDEERS